MPGTKFVADYASWLDSSTIAGEGDGSRSIGPWDLTIYSLDGTELDKISGPFAQYVVSSGHHLAAAQALPKRGEDEGSSYKIWNGTSLSDWLPGIPRAWSADGTRLAVIEPDGEPSPGIGTVGKLVIVDADGTQQSEVKGFSGRTYEPLAFSPDDRYVATCLLDSTEAGAIRVFDTETGRVSDVATDKYGDCGVYLQWSAGPTLYIDGEISKPIAWTPSGGTVPSGLPAETNLAVAANGDIANWNGSDGTLRVVHQGGETTYSVAGLVQGAIWSPDGSRLAVSTDQGLVMVVPGSTPQSAQPSPPVPVAIDAAEAGFIASAFFNDPKTHGLGTDMNDESVGTPAFQIDSSTGRPAWIVSISADTSGPAKGQTGQTTMTLSIDADTGEVTIVSTN